MNDIYIILLGLISVFLILNLPRWMQNKKIKHAITSVMEQNHAGFVLKPVKKSSYDYELMNHEVRYFLKVIPVHKKNLVITNKTTWIINKPGEAIKIENQVKGVKDFLEYAGDEKINKIGLIYPNALKILKYINENEMIVIKTNEDVDGVTFITHHELENQLKRVLQATIIPK